jgi:hypothetical protein
LETASVILLRIKARPTLNQLGPTGKSTLKHWATDIT